jgi:hypothetical protein
MNLTMGSINHKPFKIRLVNQDFKELFPHPVDTPTPKPLCHTVPVAVKRW